MKFNTDEIYKDFPQYSDEYKDFLNAVPSIEDGKTIQQWQADLDRLSKEHRAKIDAWKESHKDYFEYVAEMRERQREKCLSCIHSFVKRYDMIFMFTKEIKCCAGYTVRENGFCKAYKEKEKANGINGESTLK